MTARVRISAVPEFQTHHGRDLPDRDRMRIRAMLPAGGASPKRGELSIAMLREVVSHCDEHGAAPVLLPASPGMRAGEADRVRIADVDLEASPAVNEIRPEFSKNRTRREAGVSSEATGAIRSWLAVRGRYLGAACARASRFVAAKSPDDHRLFPFGVGVAEAQWTRAIEAPRLDERGHRAGAEVAVRAAALRGACGTPAPPAGPGS